MAYDPEVVRILVEWGRGNRVPPDIPTSIGAGESGLHPYPPRGDGGRSYGTLQVYVDADPANRLPGEQWEGYDGLRRALEKICGPRWLHWFDGTHHPDWWRTDPVGYLSWYWAKAQGADQTHVNRNAPGAARDGVAAYEDWLVKNEWLWRYGDWLCPVNGPMERGFGVVDQWAAKGHRGCDFPAAEGSPIRAVKPGIVRHANWFNVNGQATNDATGIGLSVFIEDDRGVVWRYGHCSRLYVRVGQRIRQNETIAACGSTGYSTGPHLHLERHENGQLTDPALDLVGHQPPTPPETPPEPPLPDPIPPTPPPEPRPPEPPAPPRPQPPTREELLASLNAFLSVMEERALLAEKERDYLRVYARQMIDAITLQAGTLEHNAIASNMQAAKLRELARGETMADPGTEVSP